MLLRLIILICKKRSHHKQVVVLMLAIIDHIRLSLKLKLLLDFLRDFFEKNGVYQDVDYLNTHLVPGSRVLAIDHVSLLKELNKVSKFCFFQSDRRLEEPNFLALLNIQVVISILQFFKRPVLDQFETVTLVEKIQLFPALISQVACNFCSQSDRLLYHVSDVGL